VVEVGGKREERELIVLGVMLIHRN